jgi:hypothetical protein
MADNYRKDPEASSRLTPEQYQVTQDATEPPFRNEYWDNHEPGIYVDAVSGGAAVCLDHQVQQRHWVAELHGSDRAGQRGRAARLQQPDWFGPKSAPSTATAAWATCSTTGPRRPAAAPLHQLRRTPLHRRR